jgi:mannose-6-phosphate isomerase class I
VFQEKIWGGSKLKENFNYDIPSDKTGECWAISAHENGDCTIANGEFEGKSLSWLYNNKRELFGNIDEEKFPLLVKLIDAKDKLSVQVHPNDEYARTVEGVPFGKTECWLIVDCADDAEIIIGHHAKSKEEMEAMVNNNEWDQLLHSRPIKPGDFFYIAAGTVHAICENTLILEVQQSSDTTYRFYDYGRLQDGKPRDLHLKQSLDVTTTPYTDYALTRNIFADKDIEVETLVEEEYFTVSKVKVDGSSQLEYDKPFLLCDVLSGDGKINGEDVSKGDHFILTSGETQFDISGTMEIIISSI